jgi:hypothetical protein
MSKVRSTIAVSMVILFAAMALFPSTAGMEIMKAGKFQSHSPNSSNAAILSADGTDPQPPIPIPPAFGIAS